MLRLWMISLVTLVSTLTAQVEEQNTWLKLQMQRNLDALAQMIETAYAPAQWKKERWGWDLETEVAKVYRYIENTSSPSILHYRYLLKDLFASAKDHHLAIFFYATERADLPFKIRRVDGAYCFAFIDRDYLPEEQFPVQEGDELLLFDQQPTCQVVESLCQEMGHLMDATGHALAEQTLTCRKAALGQIVPQGEVAVTIKRQKDQRILNALLPWIYTPEEISLPPLSSSLKSKDLLSDLTTVRGEKSGVWEVSSRYTYTPKLGQVLWESDESWSVHAYLFQLPSGKRYAYLRLPHFQFFGSHMREFEQILDFFEKQSTALVIDIVNNPGGSLLTVYALASLLTETPLIPPQHRIQLQPKEINRAVKGLIALADVTNDAAAQAMMGQSIEGYPVNLTYALQMKRYFQGILDQWSKGHRLTDPCDYLGIDQILPHPTVRYTKPILVLTNALCFSGSDFFAALLRDNQRAKLMGEKTAGAGGVMLEVTFPNLFGIQSCHLTTTLAQRKDQQFIENAGVTPDIPYCLTREDLTRQHSPYAARIIRELEKLK